VLERVHGLDGVANQIDENLLQLTAVAHDQRQFGLKLGLRRNIVNLQLLTERVEDANGQRIHIDRLVGLAGLTEQGANIVEHLAGAMGVAFWRALAEPLRRAAAGPLRRFGVAGLRCRVLAFLPPLGRRLMPPPRGLKDKASSAKLAQSRPPSVRVLRA
jgi:hypothetical protein